MEIWIKQGEVDLRLPVLPPSIGLQLQYNNTEIDITNYGKVNLIGNRGLASTTVSSFFPAHKYNFVQYSNFPNPKKCIKIIKKMMGNPIQYIVTEININMSMTIEEFTYSEDDSSGDIKYTLTLKEYRIPKIGKKKERTQIDRTSKKIDKIHAQRRMCKPIRTTMYTVKKGDTLCVIAKRTTGSSSNYRAIANQNNIKNPNKIYVGQKLVIKV